MLVETRQHLQTSAALGAVKPQLWYRLGQVEEALGSPGGGAEATRRAVEADTTNGEYFRVLVRQLVSAGQRGEALAVAEQRLREAPDSMPALMAIGELAPGTGEWQGAERALRKVVALHPENQQARKGLGLALGAAPSMDRSCSAAQGFERRQ